MPTIRKAAARRAEHLRCCGRRELTKASPYWTPDGWSMLQDQDAELLADAALPFFVGRPLIVCLCGSGRFREAFERAEFDETLAGNIVLTIGCNTHDVARTAELAHHKPMLDELHLRKIDLADEVLILNVGGYIGESTSRELAYAREKKKAVRFLEVVA